MGRMHRFHYSDEDGVSGGIFAWRDGEISEDNRIDHSLNIGQLVLDFKDGRLVGFEVLPPAEEVISEDFQRGSPGDPASIEIETREELLEEDGESR